MSTLDAFTTMTGIHQASSLELTPARAQEIVQKVSSNHTADADAIPVNILPVSSYVTQAKTSAGYSNVVPNLPPFAAHWGIVVGVPTKKRTALLLHLVLEEDEDGNRDIEFAMNNVGLESRSSKGAVVERVGETRFSVPELLRIGVEMIEAFGNYHIVFWNCQMFAKCYLRVITGSDAAFSHWTSADVTTLFLCAFVFPSSIASTSRTKEQRRMKQLRQVGIQAARQSSTEIDGKIKDEELLRASDEAIDLMKEAIRDEGIFNKVSKPVKDSSDKYGVIHEIKALWLKVFGS
jgi:hypothetical protein